MATVKQHFLYFLPLPHGHGSFLPVFIFAIVLLLCHTDDGRSVLRSVLSQTFLILST